MDCWKLKRGLRYERPNSNLSDAYMRKAEITLRNIPNVTEDWQIIMCYYCIYYAAYAFLVRAGFRCKIHACTRIFLEKYADVYFTKDDVTLLKKASEARDIAQYYIDRSVEEEGLLDATPRFLSKCKDIIERVTEKDIEKISAGISTRG